MSKNKPDFPFSAVQGQAEFKLALILAAINPQIGGVLVSGPRGCAKSTLARGIAGVMPHKNQLYTLPLGATEEMLIGTLDLQHVMSEQQVKFQPGLLARANNGILYVDEVNLLSDTLVDILLDVSVSGVNRVERDGVSHEHESRFVLLGTMNPDEGELRDQLLDRFGLSVQLDNQYSIEERINIVKVRESFDKDPQAFITQYQDDQNKLTSSLEDAKMLLNQVQINDAMRMEIATRSQQANVDGLRADIVWLKAASAHAAWNQRSEVTIDDIQAVERLVLSHRSRPSPETPPPTGNNNKQKENNQKENKENNQGGDWGQMDPVKQPLVSSEMQKIPMSNTQKIVAHKKISTLITKRKKITGSNKGYGKNNKIGNHPAWFGTFIQNRGQWPLKKIVFKKQRNGADGLHIIVLDTSMSTIQNRQFSKAKSIVQNIIKEAYLNREKIAVIGFGNQQVSLLIPQLRSPKSLMNFLENLPAAGGTPLREAMVFTADYQKKQRSNNPDIMLFNYLITDGKTTHDTSGVSWLGSTTVVDIEQSRIKRGKAEKIALDLGAQYLPLTDIQRKVC